MRVIDNTPSPKVARIVICHNCGVTLEYVKADTRIEKRSDYTGDTDSYRVLTCPVCKDGMDVERY
jgi:hypothetical protein